MSRRSAAQQQYQDASTLGLKLEAGFTLIEIAVAVTILGLGLTTLVALQTRALNGYIQDKMRTKVALAASYLMTVWEARNEFQNLGERTGELEQALQQVGFRESEPTENKEFQGWKYKRVIGPVDVSRLPLGGIDPNLLKPFFRKIDLEVASDDPRSPRINLTYVIRVATPPGLGALAQ